MTHGPHTDTVFVETKLDKNTVGFLEEAGQKVRYLIQKSINMYILKIVGKNTKEAK